MTDGAPGIRRVRSGRTFRYVDPDGKPVRNAGELGRIRALAIPPAYEDVWICPLPNGHIQATGRDARGRKQYRYHARWREVRDETKYARMLEFAGALPAIRQRVARDLRHAGLPREKVLAAVVRLLETTTIRVGNDEYARSNDSYGLTTLRNGHARVRGDRLTFAFRGKSGIKHAVSLHDRQLAKVVRAAQDLPGQRLFEYAGDDGAPHAVESSDVNEYIREAAGADFTAKDFRTWVGSVDCAGVLRQAPVAETPADRKRTVLEAVAGVAARLGNTAAVCRKSYVHPELLAAIDEDGTLGAVRSVRRRGLTEDERFFVGFLRRRSRETPASRTRRKLRESLRASS